MNPLSGQDAGGPILSSPATRGLEVVAPLGRHWFNEENQLLFVPFELEAGQKEARLGRYFDLKNFGDLPSQLFLYLDGLAWYGEVSLNGRLLGVTTDPFAEQLFLVKKEWLKPEGNLLEVRLVAKGAQINLYPKPFLGIFRPVALMVPSPSKESPILPKEGPRHPRKVLAVAAWTPEGGYRVDTAIWGRWMDHIRGRKEVSLFFPFRPSALCQEMVAKRGITVVSHFEADSLGFWNWYPVREVPAEMRMPFWLNEKGEPAPGFGRMYSARQLAEDRMEKPNLTFLIFCVFLPFFALLLLKGVSPKTYQSLPEYLTKGKIYLDLIANGKFLKGTQSLFLNLLRLSILSTHIALYVYYLDLSGRLEALNLLKEEGILFELYHEGGYGPMEYWLHAFIYMGAFTVLKYIILGVLGQVFKIQSFSKTIGNLDVYAAFPLNLLPLIPSALLFFTVGHFAGVLEWVWILFSLAFLARRYWAVFQGLTSLFGFSTGLKILYICAFEVLPLMVFI